MDTTIIVALIGGGALILTSFISSKISSRWTKKKTENIFLNDMQKTYQGIITDYQTTNKRLISEREQEVKRRTEMESNMEEMEKKLQLVMIKLGIVEPQRCLIENCERRVMP